MHSAPSDLEVAERYWAGPGRLRTMLGDISESDTCQLSAYLTPETLTSTLGGADGARGGGTLLAVVRLAGLSDTGLAVFIWDDRAVAVTPPFPIGRDRQSQGADVSPMLELLSARLTLGIVLLRLGRYAVGVLDGDKLVASKSGTRYVKRPHRAGGSSQRRFERSRERFAREMFDKACAVARDVLGPFEGRIQHVLLGGEGHTLQAFVGRCAYLQRLASVTLERRLNVERPGLKALEGVHREVWRSRVLVLKPQRDTESPA